MTFCNRGMDIFLNHDDLKLQYLPMINKFHIFKVVPDWYRQFTISNIVIIKLYIPGYMGLYMLYIL